MSSIWGRGWSFPPRLNDRGRMGLVDDDEDIRQAIRIIIGTYPGERVMRPDFGCRIHELIFAPNNFETAVLANQYVKEALLRWEPRINVISVHSEPDRDGDGMLMINVQYQLKNQHDTRSMVYPFYTLPPQKG